MDSSELHSSLSASSVGGHLPPGATLGAYRIVRRIALGGMGAVYEAEHAQLGRRVAIKTMLYDEGGADTQRFLNEARLIAALDHPHIVRVFDAGEAAGVRFLAMELIEGPTLSERLEREGLLDVDDAVDLLRQVATGVHAAHEAGILHRDLKPSNVLVDAEGRARLGDFGTARSNTDQRLTVTGVVIGTPSYMAPEQALGDPDALGPAVDVYGLGATLYHLLAGEPPFERGSQLATMQAVVTEPVPDPRSLRRGLSADLVAVCLKCLAKAPEERYATAREVADDLARFLAGEPTAARPIGPIGRAAKAIRRNALIVSVTTVLTLLFAVLVALSLLPTLLSRNLVRLETAAEAWREDRVAALTTELEQPGLSPERLRALRSALTWETLQADASAALEGGPPDRAEAITRGLGLRADYRARVDPLRARIALRLATDDDVRELSEAAVRDPEGEAGRTARLRIGLQLMRGEDPRGHDLAQTELRELAATDDAAGQRARLALARAAACRNDWLGVLGHLGKAAPSSAGDRELRAGLHQLARTLTPLLPIPSPRCVLIPGKQSRLATLSGNELSVYDASPSGLEPLGSLKLGESGRVLAVAGVEGWGKTQLVAFLQVPTELRLGAIDLSQTPFQLEPIARATPLTGVRGRAQGDFNGDGATDIVLVPFQDGGAALVVWGGPQVRLERLFPRNVARPYAFASALAADLDGDGKDELLLGPSLHGKAIEVFRHQANSNRLTPSATIPSGKVHALRSVRLAKREAALASVDYRSPEPFQAPDPKQAWHGSDGVYVIEDEGRGPAITRRWTIGPDQAPTPASRRLAAGLAGFGLTLGAENWVVRAYRDSQDRWVWELTPFDRLRLKTNASAALQLRGARGVPSQIVDIDGDGDPELLFGSVLHGLGVATSEGPKPLPRLVVASPARLLRAARQARALGKPDVATELLARLRAEHPQAWAAQVAELEEIDDLLWRAREARRVAGRRFASSDTAGGSTFEAESRRLFTAAAQAAELKATQVALSGACWAKAAHARVGLGDDAAARKAVDAALRQDDLSGDSRARLRAERRLLVRQGRLETTRLPRSAAKSGELGIVRPEGVRFEPEGLSIRCQGGVADGVLTRVELDPRPLRVRAHVRLEGNAWSARLRLGIVAAEKPPREMTGIELGLHDVATQRLHVQAIVAGRPVGLRCELPRYDTELHLAFELIPLAGGESNLRLEVRDARRKLLFRRSRVAAVAAPTPGAHHLGVVAPRAGNLHNVNMEQPAWRMTSWARVLGLEVDGIQPQRRAADIAPRWSAHAHLIAGSLDTAERQTQRVLSDDTRPERHRLIARWALGLIKGRQGRTAGGAEAMRAVARANPHQALLWFEDLAEFLDPKDRPVVDAALDLLRADPDPLLVAIANSLRGRLTPTPNPSNARLHRDDPIRHMTIAHLTMRNVYLPRGVRYQRLELYLKSGAAHGPRPPRNLFPRVLLDVRGLDERELPRLLRGASDATRTQHQLLQATLIKPTAFEPWLGLASLYTSQRMYGLTEEALLKGLERAAQGTQRQSTWLKLAYLRASLRRNLSALVAVKGYLAAGGAKTDLQSLPPSLRQEPRFKQLLGAH